MIASPESLSILAGGLPSELVLLRQWVNWRHIRRGDAWTKPPLDPQTLEPADVTDPTTWGSVYRALSNVRDGHAEGIGFVFADDPFTGVDVDDCINRETGEIAAEALVIVAQLRSYTEFSPSGSGLHIIVRGSKPAGPCRAGNLEMYDGQRFFTVTGRRLPGTPATIGERSSALRALHRWRFTIAPPSPPPALQVRVVADDDEILSRMFGSSRGAEIQRLWDGDTRAHGGDPSRADAALCRHLAYWAGGDPVRIDRLFRQSGLFRAKWDRSDGTHGSYGRRTIAYVLGRLCVGR